MIRIPKIRFTKILVVIPVLIFAISGTLYSQIDSINYNFYRQIYEFQIINNEYSFTMEDSRLAESDRTIFNTDKYFSNFQNTEYSPDYLDSVYYVLVSRVLKKSYNQIDNYNRALSFIRICWLRESDPIVLCISDLQANHLKLRYTLTNANYFYNGDIKIDTLISLNERHSNKIQKLIELPELVLYKNDLKFDSDYYFPYELFIEIYDEKDYNIFALNQFLVFQSKKYKNIRMLINYLEKISNDQIVEID